MRFMVIMKGDHSPEEMAQAPEEMYAAMGTFNERLAEAGVMKLGEGLVPSSEGKRIVFQGTPGTTPKVVDGPFAESKELVAGFWIWECRDWDEAMDWAQQIPQGGGEEYHVEVRRVAEVEDLGEGFTEELQAREDALRAKLEDA